jgi:hypothetical protein
MSIDPNEALDRLRALARRIIDEGPGGDAEEFAALFDRLDDAITFDADMLPDDWRPEHVADDDERGNGPRR